MGKKTIPPPVRTGAGANGTAAAAAGRGPTPAERRLADRAAAAVETRGGRKADPDPDEEMPIGAAGRTKPKPDPKPKPVPEPEPDDDETEEDDTDVDDDDDIEDDDDDETTEADASGMRASDVRPGTPADVGLTEAPADPGELPIMAMGSDARATGQTLAAAYTGALDALDSAEADYYRWLADRGIKGTRRWHRTTDANGDPHHFKAGRKGKIVAKGSDPDVEIID